MRATICVILGLALASACGGGDDKGGNEFESKQLGDLTTEEQGTLCQDVASWNSTMVHDQAYVEGHCLQSAITTASLNAAAQQLTLEQMRANCTSLQTQCIQQGLMAPLPGGCAYPATCTATVGDLKACTLGTYDAFLDVFATLPSCDQMQTDTVAHIDLSPLSATAVTTPCGRVLACGTPM